MAFAGGILFAGWASVMVIFIFYLQEVLRLWVVAMVINLQTAHQLQGPACTRLRGARDSWMRIAV